MGILSKATTRTKILDNTFLNFDNLISVSIVEFVFVNTNDVNSFLRGFRVKGMTDFGLEFNLFEDRESGVRDRCVTFILNNWKVGVEIAGQNTWLNMSKFIATRITESEEPDSVNPLKINYIARLYGVSAQGKAFELASYTRPKGIENNIIIIEQFRDKTFS